MKKTIALGLIGGALAFTACKDNKTQPEHEYLEGTVVKEAGTLPGLLQSPGGIINNETVKLGKPTYVLQIQTDKGLYTASIFEDSWNSRKTLEALETSVDIGTKLKFVRKDRFGYKFDSDKIGRLYTKDITIIYD